MITRCILCGLFIGALILSYFIDRGLDFAWASMALLVAMGIRAAWEWSRAMRSGPAAYGGLLVAGAALLPFLEALWMRWAGAAMPMEPLAFFLFFTALALRAVLSGHVQDGLDRIGRTLCGFVILYLFYRLLPVLLDKRIGGGLATAYALVFTSKACDIGAYVAGRAFGKRKLIPRVSPGKTRAGAVGGLALSGVAGGILLPWAVAAPVWAGLLFGTWLGLVTMLGDLFESLVKRCAGIKDSSSLLPEMGGVLDLIDSLILAAPAGYLFLAGFSRFAAAG